MRRSLVTVVDQIDNLVVFTRDFDRVSSFLVTLLDL